MGLLLDSIKLLVKQFIIDAKCNLAKQLDKATVGIVAKALVACLIDLPYQGL